MAKIFLILIICCLVCNQAFTQLPEYKILPDTGTDAGGFGFGRSVAIDGNYACIGASGRIFIFKKSGIHWIKKQVLSGFNNPPGSTMSAGFGSSVCISGDYIIAGAPFHAEPPVLGYYGAAYIFNRKGENWELQEKFLPPDGFQYNLFGWSVAISSSFAIVGEAGKSKTYIYQRNGETWSHYTTLKNGYRFGESVAIFGEYLAIGSVGGSFLGPAKPGSAYIFFNGGENWTRQARLQASDSSDVDNYGEALSISDAFLIAGDDKALNADSIGTGAAYMYNRQDIFWAGEQKLTPSDGNAGDLFGSSVAISGDYAIISAVRKNDKGVNSGAAYIFKNNGGNWIEQYKLLASDGESYDNFASSVSIAGNSAIVGTPGDDDCGNNSGAAYIYSDFITDIENALSENPVSFHLSQNYPNPFNPQTTIEFDITGNFHVTLNVYDIQGREVATLVNERLSPGHYMRTFRTADLASGVYLYQIRMGEACEIKKMTLVR